MKQQERKKAGNSLRLEAFPDTQKLTNQEDN